jgi:dihydropteroate synthase
MVVPRLGGDARRVFGRREFDFSRRVAVMAVVNRTPDSFHDRGRTYGLDAAVGAVGEALAEGADWLDVGGAPFSPDRATTEAVELDRVIPVIEAARARTDAVISVDTARPEVARQALAAGADVVNDTSGLHDPEIADVVAAAGGGLVVVHCAAPPRTHLRRPAYDDVVAAVADFLTARVELATSRGVPETKIIIDPGHDLNKNTFHSLELTRRLDELAVLGFPLLAAVSNKDFIGETLGAGQDDRLEATLAAEVVCVLQGARVLRVHDVAEAVAAVRLTEAVLGWRPPLRPRHNLE